MAAQVAFNSNLHTNHLNKKRGSPSGDIYGDEIKRPRTSYYQPSLSAENLLSIREFSKIVKRPQTAPGEIYYRSGSISNLEDLLLFDKSKNDESKSEHPKDVLELFQHIPEHNDGDISDEINLIGRDRSNSDPNFTQVAHPSALKRIKSDSITYDNITYVFEHINVAGYNQLPPELFKYFIHYKRIDSNSDADELLITKILNSLKSTKTINLNQIEFIKKKKEEAIELCKKAFLIATEILFELNERDSQIIKKDNSFIEQKTDNKFINLLEVNPFISFFLIDGIDITEIPDDCKFKKKGFHRPIQKINLDNLGYSCTQRLDIGSSTLNNMIIYPKSIKILKELKSDVSTFLLPGIYNYYYPLELLSRCDTPKSNLKKLISCEKTKVSQISYNGEAGDLFTDFKETQHRNNPLSNPMGIMIELDNGKKIILTTFHLSSSNCKKPLKQIIQLYGVLKILYAWSKEYNAQVISSFDANIDGRNSNDAFRYLISGEVPESIGVQLRKLNFNPDNFKINNPMKLVFTNKFIKDKYTQSSRVNLKERRFLDYIGWIGPAHLSFLENVEPQIFSKETNLRLTDHKTIIAVGSCPYTYKRERITSNISEDTIPEYFISKNKSNSKLDNFYSIEAKFKSGKTKAPITYLKKNSRGILLFAIIGYCCKIDQSHFSQYKQRDRDSLEKGDVIEIYCEEFESNNQNPFRGRYLKDDSPDEKAIISIQKDPTKFSNQFYVQK